MTTSDQAHGAVAEFLRHRAVRARDSARTALGQETMRAYCELLDLAIDSAGFDHSLFRSTPSHLYASDAVVYFLRRSCSTEMACALHTAPDPSGSFIWINGVVKRPGTPPESVRELMAIAIEGETKKAMRAVTLKACVRVFPQGFRDKRGRAISINEASLKLFREFGFQRSHVETVRIEGALQDRHLARTAEHCGKTFRTAILESTSSTSLIAKELVKLFSVRKGRV